MIGGVADTDALATCIFPFIAQGAGVVGGHGGQDARETP